MAGLLTETRIPLADLAQKESVNPTTVWRWCVNGCRGVKLESFSVGLRRFTTRQAFERFVAAPTAVAA